MLLIALVYLLLAMRIKVRAGVAFCEMQGSVFIEFGALGLSFRQDRRVNLAEKMRCLRAQEDAGSVSRKRQLKTLRLLRAGRFESVCVHARLGVDDAAKTAVAAGAARAALLAAATGMNIRASVIVDPDFEKPCFLLSARGIYSFCAGDIILAAAAAWIQKQKEGFGWKSIPLRA